MDFLVQKKHNQVTATCFLLMLRRKLQKQFNDHKFGNNKITDLSKDNFKNLEILSKTRIVSYEQAQYDSEKPMNKDIKFNSNHENAKITINETINNKQYGSTGGSTSKEKLQK